MRSQVNDLITVLVTLAHIISTTTLPVSTAGLRGFLGGITGLEKMLDDLRGLLPVEMWPDDAVCSFLSAKKVLTEAADREEMVEQPFANVGMAAANLGAASAEIVRNLPSRSAQMAMTIITIGPIVLASPFFQRFFVKGITIGSLKE